MNPFSLGRIAWLAILCGALAPANAAAEEFLQFFSNGAKTVARTQVTAKSIELDTSGQGTLILGRGQLVHALAVVGTTLTIDVDGDGSLDTSLPGTILSNSPQQRVGWTVDLAFDKVGPTVLNRMRLSHFTGSDRLHYVSESTRTTTVTIDSAPFDIRVQDSNDDALFAPEDDDWSLLRHSDGGVFAGKLGDCIDVDGTGLRLVMGVFGSFGDLQECTP